MIGFLVGLTCFKTDAVIASSVRWTINAERNGNQRGCHYENLISPWPARRAYSRCVEAGRTIYIYYRQWRFKY